MSTILSWLTPWWVKAALAALVLAILAYGVHSYNTAVSAKAVVAALKNERAKTQPIIDELEFALLTEQETVKSMIAAAKIEKAKQTKAANEKTTKYNASIKLYKEVFELYSASLLSQSELTDRLRNIAEQSSSSATNTSDSGFTRRLGESYAQCESDLRGLLETAGSANERAAKAEAGLRALKQ